MRRALMVGGSRGLGRGVVDGLRGWELTVIGRDAATLGELHGVSTVRGDGADESLAERELRERRPDLLVIAAGAAPVLGPFHELSWAEFETNWRADAKIAFVWLRQALRLPMAPGSHIIVVSSGAAVQGSPVSGGYAAAKRAQWFLAQYAAAESERAKLGIRVHCVLPNLNPSTELGRAAITAYATRAGISEDEFAKRFLPHLTPAIFGAAIADLADHPAKWDQLAYRLGGSGLSAV